MEGREISLVTRGQKGGGRPMEVCRAREMRYGSHRREQRSWWRVQEMFIRKQILVSCNQRAGGESEMAARHRGSTTRNKLKTSKLCQMLLAVLLVGECWSSWHCLWYLYSSLDTAWRRKMLPVWMTVYPRLVAGDWKRGSFYYLLPQQPAWESYRERIPWEILDSVRDTKGTDCVCAVVKTERKWKHVFTSNSVISHCRQVD